MDEKEKIAALKSDGINMVEFGDLYPDQVFFVIRCCRITSSLGPLITWIYQQLFFCEELGNNGIKPVVDLSINWNTYLREEEVGIVNPWEYFFEQTSSYGLNAVYHSKNVILGDPKADFSALAGDPIKQMVEDLQYRSRCAELFKKYIFVKGSIVRKADELYQQLFSGAGRILGVTYRGTDYRNRPVVGEHRQPSIEEEMDMAEQLLKEWNCDTLFLTTEDASAVQMFQDRFGDRLRFVPKQRFPSDVKVTWLTRFDREHDEYLKGEEYLLEILLLARCNCLLSGRLGILLVALPLNDRRYEQEYIYDLGLYEEKDFGIT